MTGRDAERCRELFANLSEYLDGELPAAICSEIDSHMEDCPPCVRFIESLRRTVSMLHRFPAKAMPENLRQEILKAAGRLKRPGPE